MVACIQAGLSQVSLVPSFCPRPLLFLQVRFLSHNTELLPFPQSFLWRADVLFETLCMDLTAGTFSCTTLCWVHFSAGCKCYCYWQSNKTMEGFYKQLRTKKYLHQSVYSSGRKRLVLSSVKVFWREPVPPHPRTDFWCALEKWVVCGPPSTCVSVNPVSFWDTSAPCPCCAPFGLCRESVGRGDLSTSQGYLQSCHLAG